MSAPVSPPRWVFASALGLAAALGMALQPMLGKQVLVAHGGTPGVWSVVVVFFQAALLAGYALAHGLVQRTSDRLAAGVLLTLLGLGVWMLPPSLDPAPLGANTGAWGPGPRLFVSLAASVGPAAVAIFALSPLLQRWFAGRHPDRDPYPLYAASNLGSLIGLLGYPLILEPTLTASEQARGWGAAFVALAAVTVWTSWRAGGPTELVGASTVAPGLRRRWLVAAAVPSAALLAITAHITTDLAPVPLLWVVPLAIYLCTWIVAFGPAGPTCGRIAMAVLPLATAAVAPLAIMAISTPVLGVTGLLLAWLALAGLALHGEIAATRPDPHHLTGFYLTIALGGAVGGAAVAFVAPAALDRAIDLPIVLVVTMLAVRRPGSTSRAALATVAVGVAATAAWVLLSAHTEERAGFAVAMAPFALFVLVYLPSVRWPRPAALSLAALVTVATLAVQTHRPALAVTRSFFASYRVVADPQTQLRWLAHGQTIHGAESTRRPGECLPYHHPHSPAAAIFAGVRGEAPRIAVVGLGIGCMVDLAPANATIDFFEIDAEVERLARSHFSALSRCGARCSVQITDGRLGLSVPGPAYDLIVLDAFASDAIPVHLVTREALLAYSARLSPEGTLAVHVTNRHVDLRRVVVATGAAASLRAAFGEYVPADDEVADPVTVEFEYAATRFVALSRDGHVPTPHGRAGLHFAEAAPSTTAPWTDAHAPLRDILFGRQ